MKFENINVFNFEGAIRGMRNPLESWHKMDSYWDENCNFIIGENDMTLMKKLINAGPEHSKFMRQIFVNVDISAPLLWWKEMDQYKVATTTDSCSTMHCIHKKPFDIKDFDVHDRDDPLLRDIIIYLNQLRQNFILTNDKSKWYTLIELLPSSYIQKRTWTGDYAVVRSIAHQRINHKLDFWSETFMNDFVKRLPYCYELLL